MGVLRVQLRASPSHAGRSPDLRPTHGSSSVCQFGSVGLGYAVQPMLLRDKANRKSNNRVLSFRQLAVRSIPECTYLRIGSDEECNEITESTIQTVAEPRGQRHIEKE